ncbi:MAG TPA: helix-turn-helix domain-containing protein [Niabella sp.]|nr:helix-turn-helix domain-containing protein [Niabella sp.]
MKHKKQHTSDKNGSNLGDMPKGVIKVYRYHLRGLTSKEIAKLSGVSLRTVQRWKQQFNFDKLAATPPPELETIQQKAVKMAKVGLSYSEIGRKLKRCKATIYNYIRQERAKQPESEVGELPE